MKLFQKSAVLALSMAMIFGVFSAQAEEKKNYTYTEGEVVYEIGMEKAEAFKTLGEAKSDRDVNTCANGYVNKAYTFGQTDKDIEVYCEQDKEAGKEIVASITLLTANVATEEGLKVGDDADAVVKAYPDAKKGLGSYTTVKGDTEIYIKMKGKNVSYIAYQSAE